MFADGQCFIISSAEALCKAGGTATDARCGLQDSAFFQLEFHNDAGKAQRVSRVGICVLVHILIYVVKYPQFIPQDNQMKMCLQEEH